MAQQKPKTVKKPKATISVVEEDGKNVKDTPKNARKNVIKQATTQKTKTVKKTARKPRGKQFTSEYQPNNKCGGRPQTDFSHRAMAKVRAKKDPNAVLRDLDTLDRIASDPDNPQCLKAIELKIKLNGNFDPQETKDVTPVQQPDSPLFSLSIEELRSLKALKDNQSGTVKEGK